VNLPVCRYCGEELTCVPADEEAGVFYAWVDYSGERECESPYTGEHERV